jgi:hypothetical protein
MLPDLRKRDIYSRSRAPRDFVEGGGAMNGWDIVMWTMVSALLVFRVALIVAVVVVVIAIVRSLIAGGSKTAPPVAIK